MDNQALRVRTFHEDMQLTESKALDRSMGATSCWSLHFSWICPATNINKICAKLGFWKGISSTWEKMIWRDVSKDLPSIRMQGGALIRNSHVQTVPLLKDGYIYVAISYALRKSCMVKLLHPTLVHWPQRPQQGCHSMHLGALLLSIWFMASQTFLEVGGTAWVF